MNLSIAELRKYAEENNVCIDTATSKDDIRTMITKQLTTQNNEHTLDLQYLQIHISKINKSISTNRDIIVNLCEHDFISEVSYGDRTQYICRKCGTYQ